MPEPNPTPSPSLVPTLALIGAVVLWGSSFASMRVALRSLSPESMLWARMTVALAVLLPALPRLWPGLPALRRHWPALLGLVLFQPCLSFTLEANALRFTTSSQAGIVAASAPLLTAVGARVFLGERLGPGAMLGLTVSMAGVVWLTLAGNDGGQAADALLGNALELAAMAATAAYIRLSRRLSAHFGPWTLTAMQMAAGTLFFLPGGMSLPRPGAPAWTPELALLLAYLGILVTLAGFGLYNWGVSRTPAGRASAFFNLVPVTAVLLGWLLLDETLTPWQTVAAGLVLLGVWLSQRRA